MQTFRKLPKHSPRMAAPTSRIGSATTGHLEEQDARRDGDVQRFRALGQRDRYAFGGDGVELGPDARALVADDDGDRAGAARLDRPRERLAVRRGGPPPDVLLARPPHERPLAQPPDPGAGRR